MMALWDGVMIRAWALLMWNEDHRVIILDLPKVYKRAVLSLVAGQPIYLTVFALFLDDPVFLFGSAKDLLP